MHGEKVAFGILVQLRLEEMIQGSAQAEASRQKLLKFYDAIGLPKSLTDLGLGAVSVDDLTRAAIFACKPDSDMHHLPFKVSSSQVVEAMISTVAAGSVK